MKEKNASGKAKRPSVGIGVLIVNNDGHILLSKRLKEYGFGKLALPGGHVEWMESLVETAKREVLEETGIALDKVEELRDYTEEIRPLDGKHYVTFYLIARMPDGQQPRQMEPKKHGPWGWYDPFKLPRHAWSPTKRLIKRSGHLVSAFVNQMKLTPKKISEETMERILGA
jgi:8-oxo-dGTP diphosphatase